MWLQGWYKRNVLTFSQIVTIKRFGSLLGIWIYLFVSILGRYNILKIRIHKFGKKNSSVIFFSISAPPRQFGAIKYYAAAVLLNTSKDCLKIWRKNHIPTTTKRKFFGKRLFKFSNKGRILRPLEVIIPCRLSALCCSLEFSIHVY